MTTRVFVLAFVIALVSGSSGVTGQGGGQSDHFPRSRSTLTEPFASLLTIAIDFRSSARGP